MSGGAGANAGTNGRARLTRGLAGGVRREVRPEERAALAALRPDAQTQAVLDTLPTPATPPGTAPPHDAGARPAAASNGTARPVHLIATDAITPSPHQARRHFAGIEALAQSIADSGLQHPVLVRRNPPGAAAPYMLVFGERRYRAFQQLGRDADAERAARHHDIPAFVLETDELSDARLAILTAEENAQRAGLTAWELAQNVVRLKAALDADAERPVRFDTLARHFNLQAGSTNEYFTIGTALPETVLRDAGLVQHDAVDWPRVARLKKQRLLAIARKPAEERVALLRAYVGVDGTPRRRGGGPRFSVQGLRDEGGFALKIEKPISSASYSRSQSESFLRDLEPALALLAEIAGNGAVAYRPDAPNLPGAYLVLRDRPEHLAPDERRAALATLDELRRELSTPGEPGHGSRPRTTGTRTASR